MFGAVKITKNAYPDKYVYTGYRIGFDSRLEFSLPDVAWEKCHYCWSLYELICVYFDNKGKDILIVGEVPTQ